MGYRTIKFTFPSSLVYGRNRPSYITVTSICGLLCQIRLMIVFALTNILIQDLSADFLSYYTNNNYYHIKCIKVGQCFKSYCLSNKYVYI